ncbi:hypothetical protein B0T19DRAFT_136543 [Cercophora scortea]|uniref:Uncharacterized protein n=1 Tax=Cercophora scortea TaxID=314031 RepID=A0AAE0IYR1_9PEZI|nr:hypothetical protein B0T19DRAFT_136543 [Cercophora scortea]
MFCRYLINDESHARDTRPTEAKLTCNIDMMLLLQNELRNNADKNIPCVQYTPACVKASKKEEKKELKACATLLFDAVNHQIPARKQQHARHSLLLSISCSLHLHPRRSLNIPLSPALESNSPSPPDERIHYMAAILHIDKRQQDEQGQQQTTKHNTDSRQANKHMSPTEQSHFGLGQEKADSSFPLRYPFLLRPIRSHPFPTFPSSTSITQPSHLKKQKDQELPASPSIPLQESQQKQQMCVDVNVDVK